ncbi:MAG: sodium/glucose cotransporter, partial [Bacteroidota bacterium]
NLEIPFLQQMLITALLTMAIIAIYSLVQNKGADDEKGIKIDGDVFETGRIFNISALTVIGILVILYIAFW